MKMDAAGRSGQGHAGAWLQALRGLRSESWGESIAGYLFIGPAVLVFLVFNAYSVIRGLVIAFSDYRYLLPDHEPFNGLDNWIEMVGDKVFLQSLGRSLEFTLVYAVLNFGFAFMVAVLISQVQARREASVYRVLAYLPAILPIAIAVLIWRQLLSPEFGYISYFLKKVLGFSSSPEFMRDVNWIVPSLAVMAAWRAMGSNVLLLLVGLYNVNNELYEAASIDGAGWWRRLYSITLPLLRPSFTIVFVLAAGVLGSVEESLVYFGLTDAGVEGAGRLIGRYAYEIAFIQGDLRWGYAAAMNLTVGIISMILSGIVFRILRSDSN